MRKFVIFAVILSVISLYFIVNAEKFIRIGNGGAVLNNKPKTDEATPTGTDLTKLILNKTKGAVPALDVGQMAKSVADGELPTIESLKNKAKNLTAQMAAKIGETIKEPIEDRLNDAFCKKK